MSRDTGGPAFPIIDGQTIHRIGAAAVVGMENAGAEERDVVYLQAVAQAASGISLRDYFAARAPMPIPDWFKHEATSPRPVTDKEKTDAWRNQQRELKFFAWRWYYADMMIAERAK